MKKNENSLTMPKKLKGTLCAFLSSILSEKNQIIERGTFAEKFVFEREKVSQGQKDSTGVPFGPVEFLR